VAVTRPDEVFGTRRVNLDAAGEHRWWKGQLWYAAVVLLLPPLFSTLEAAGVIYGFVKPEAGLHVVKE
jgi:hypothetical protein